MKLAFKIPQRYLPNFLRSDIKAVEKFKAELDQIKTSQAAIKKEQKDIKNKVDQAPVKKVKRVSVNLTQRRKYIATMQQDELKEAVMIAKDPLRPRRDLLYAMYDEVWENDGQVIAEAQKAILKVVGSPFGVFEKGSDEIDLNSTRLLQRTWFEALRTYWHEARFFGHSLIQITEFVAAIEEGIDYEIKKVELIPREHVRPEDGFIVMDVSDDTGIPFREPYFKDNLLLLESGLPKNLGLLRVACKEFIWKNYSRSDWSRLCEKYGLPWLVIKAATTDEVELDKLEKMAANFGEDLYAILDPEDSVEIMTNRLQNPHTIFKEKAEMCNAEISKAFSGGTATSDEKSFVGSAEVHADILNEFVEAAKRRETYYNNEELFPFLIKLGYPFEGKEFRYLKYQENNDDNNPEAETEDKGAGGADPAKKKNASKSGQSLFKSRKK